MTSFLDKLAMEVSEWGKGGGVVWVEATNGEVVASRDIWTNNIVKSQWLQRRKELINEPRDCDAPVWAKWKAQDSDGEWRWYMVKPFAGIDGWQAGARVSTERGKVPAGHDWRKTLKEVKRETKVEAEEIMDPIDSEIIRTIAMIRVETNAYVRFSFVDHLDLLLEAIRNKLADSVEGKGTSLAQRKIQSVLDSGDYREMKGATILVDEDGSAAIVTKGAAFYWVNNELMSPEYDLAGEGGQ